MSEEFKSFYKRVTGNEGERCHYSTRLDTYGCGCSHDCAYCYAKSLLDFRKLWNPSHPTSANIEKVVRTIRRNLKRGDVVRLGGMTDCFQAIESERRVTYKAIEELNRLGVHYLIVTKSDLVARDDYIAVMDRSLAHIQISITSTDDELAKTYERAPSPSRRIRAVEKLADAGFDVCVRLSPYIPQYVDLRIINAIRCDKILVEFLRVNTWIRKWFDIDYSEYTLNHGGYKHLTLERKRELLAGITGFREVSVCEDVPEHWEYWRTHTNANADDCCNLRLSQHKAQNMETKNYDGLPSWLNRYNLAPIEWEGNIVFVGVLPVKLLEQNDGQIEGLPRNPREWSRDDFENLKKSIVETPELTAARGCIVYPRPNAEKLVALGGNMRLAAVKELKKKTIPVAIYPENTAQAKLMEIAAKDNGVFGKWDFDALGNEWDSLPLGEWGIPAWKPVEGTYEEFKEDGGNEADAIERATEKLSGLEYNPLYYQPDERPTLTLANCVDTSKYEAKVRALGDYDLTEAQREALKIFAYRFIRIDFESVADYYAFNASDEEKRAMERLRLVLTDDGKNGFIEDDLLKVGKMTEIFSEEGGE